MPKVDLEPYTEGLRLSKLRNTAQIQRQALGQLCYRLRKLGQQNLEIGLKDMK